MTNFVCSADLVKTPEANPKVVLLALRITSSSVSKGRMDMTGPKISSFTQVMSSLQSSVRGESAGCKAWCILKMKSTKIRGLFDTLTSQQCSERTVQFIRQFWCRLLFFVGGGLLKLGSTYTLYSPCMPPNTQDWLFCPSTPHNMNVLQYVLFGQNCYTSTGHQWTQISAANQKPHTGGVYQ